MEDRRPFGAARGAPFGVNGAPEFEEVPVLAKIFQKTSGIGNSLNVTIGWRGTI
jgi:hypothetical protein